MALAEEVVVEDGMMLTDGDSVDVGRGVIEGMVVIEEDNDGGVSLGRIGAEGEAVKLGDAVNRIEGRGVAEGITVDDGDDEGAMEKREIEDGKVLADGVVVIVGRGVVEGV